MFNYLNLNLLVPIRNWMSYQCMGSFKVHSWWVTLSGIVFLRHSIEVGLLFPHRLLWINRYDFRKGYHINQCNCNTLGCY